MDSALFLCWFYDVLWFGFLVMFVFLVGCIVCFMAGCLGSQSVRLFLCFYVFVCFFRFVCLCAGLLEFSLASHFVSLFVVMFVSIVLFLVS